jgi:hypothetical protein
MALMTPWPDSLTTCRLLVLLRMATTAGNPTALIDTDRR